MTMQPKNPRASAAPVDLTRCYAASDRQRTVSRRSQALLAAAGEFEPCRRWFVVTVANGADRAVVEAMTFAGVSVWAPYVMVKAPRRPGRGGERKSYPRLAMPGYVFAYVAATVDAWSGLATIKGVTGILGSAGRPIAVADDIVDLLKAYLLDDPDAVKKVTDAVEPGDRVIVRDGPFCSFPGLVDSVDEDFGRAVVEVIIFGRATPVHLDLAQIARL